MPVAYLPRPSDTLKQQFAAIVADVHSRFEHLVFDSQDDASQIIALLMRHWNTIAAEL